MGRPPLPGPSHELIWLFSGREKAPVLTLLSWFLTRHVEGWSRNAGLAGGREGLFPRDYALPGVCIPVAGAKGQSYPCQLAHILQTSCICICAASGWLISDANEPSEEARGRRGSVVTVGVCSPLSSS